MDRRSFLITSSAVLAAPLAQWTGAPAAAAIAGRRVGRDAADLFDLRLKALRHLDDQVGAGETYQAATTELQMITQVLDEGSYAEPIGRRLFAAAAEVSRLAGWCAHDLGRTAAAERHFRTALRAAADADDATTSAIVLAFWANLRYVHDDPGGALNLIDRALATRRRITSPRALALLHVRQARARSVARQPSAAYRAIEDAVDAYDRAGPAAEDRPGLSWVSAGEIHQSAGNAALTLGDPRRALTQFDAALSHHDPYDENRETRGVMIYLARRAQAHLASGDLDAAVDAASRVLTMANGVASARAADSLSGLRADLTAYRHVAMVRDFLELINRRNRPDRRR
ncbi:hypothetical protein [Planomonospora sp. ID82291]|uniref:hypothetical protein n=1 Tax=Planomonospora sp. ID82291 TaxID=2738136 RepID=UPI0018C3C7A9|nr:hypothetical protein [Planomonospora sp. ID82291]MBG0818385.1 transcriptional regulator [Planomonospora sp. ID82291]